MRVSLNHAQGLPSSERLDGEQIDALHGEAGCEGVPSIVKAEIFDLGGADGRREGFLGPSKVTLALSVGEYERRPIQRAREPRENLPDGGVHRDMTSFPVLRACDRQHRGL